MNKPLLLAGAALASLSAPALAQDDPATAADAEVVDSNVIIVTAQGREQRLLDVPLAVSAVQAESLQNSGASDIRQLNQLAPSLLVSSTGSEANGSARIRGIGTVGDNPGLESSVAVFVDGVYRSRSGIGLNELGAVERIEVLRGPQGTLFGRNASAGLINVISAAPQFEHEGTAEASYGNYDYYRLGAGFTGPIGDSGFAYRIEGVYVNRDGFYEDTISGQDVNDRDRYFIRGQMLYEASPDLSFRLIGDYTRRDESCCAAVYATTDLEPSNAGLLTTQNPIIPVLLAVAGVDYATFFPSAGDPYDRNIAITPGRSYGGETEDWGASLQVDWDLGGARLTAITGYRQYDSFQESDTDYGLVDILYREGDDSFRREFATFSQEIRFQGEAFGGVLDWLVGGYYAHETLDLTDNLKFGSEYGRFAACRLIGSGGLAVFFDASQSGCISPTGRAVLSGVVPGVPSPFGPAGPAIVAGLDRLDTVRNVGDDNALYEQTSENFAFFTHNIISLTDTIDLTLGVRYTNESKDFAASFNNTNTICPAQQAALLPLLAIPGLTPVVGGLIGLACQGNSTAGLNSLNLSDSRSEDEFTGTAVLSWRPGDDWLVYASFSRGYKAGGFNLDRSALTSSVLFPLSSPSSGLDVGRLQFDQEEVDAFEIGVKYESRDVQLAAALFHQEFSNFQLNTFNGTVFLVQNINGCSADLGTSDEDLSAATGACAPEDVGPGVSSTGVEVEASVVPVDYLRLSAGITVADMSYANDLVGTDDGAPLDPALRLLPGNRLSNAPGLVVTGALTWTPPIGDTGLSGLFYVDTRVNSGYNTGSDQFPQKFQDGFALVNARIGLRGRDNVWAVEAWAQNLFDQGYTQVAFNTPFQAGPGVGAHPNFPAADYPGGTQVFSAFLAEPRTYGLTVRTRF
ncbi:MAG: TonB-dependent receptor [Sphingomonadaceae bacterium]|nr:TonB-dependent receptor [Sphingomonadaceae bacterium]